MLCPISQTMRPCTSYSGKLAGRCWSMLPCSTLSQWNCFLGLLDRWQHASVSCAYKERAHLFAQILLASGRVTALSHVRQMACQGAP